MRLVIITVIAAIALSALIASLTPGGKQAGAALRRPELTQDTIIVSPTAAPYSSPAAWPRLETLPALDGFTTATYMTSIVAATDGRDRLFITEQGGLVHRLDRTGGAWEPAAVFMDIRDRVAYGDESGLFSVAFPPDFPTRNDFYVMVVNRGRNTSASARSGIQWRHERIGSKESLMLRNTFLTLSHSDRLRKLATDFAPARRISRRWVAGETLQQAVQVLKRLKEDNLLATLDYLGENTDSENEANFYTEEQMRALDAVAAAGVEPNCSLKLTAMGLDISDDLATRNLRRLLERAKRYDNSFVRIDMESSEVIDRTFAIYERMRAEGFDNVGVVIQTYLYRSEKDVLHLIETGAKVRLVKGAYDEPPHLAFPDKADVDKNFVHLMKLLMSKEARDRGVYTAIATHDTAIIAETQRHAAENNIPRDQFEFQMLYGIATGMHHDLANQGYKFRVYVPYGTHWYPYFMRRLAERPANVAFIVKGMFRK